ncbi:MAG TPA: tetratricopeptide repeat protein [Solirubrobacteraceae bacterium]
MDGSGSPAKASPSRRRGRRRGLEIRPGSVKEARAMAGLSLGQVARGDLSRTAIYFVETGKAKPSRETLELIASRTGQPLDFFLADGGDALEHSAARIAELERLLATGDNAGVVAAADKALVQRRDAESEARVKLLASLAHLRLSQPVVGRRLAVSARAYFEQVGNLEMVAECLGQEASGAQLMQDPAAVQIAEGALATCRSLKPVPSVLETRLLGTLGNTLVTANRWREAIDRYNEAIRAADVIQDLYRLSLMYSGLSLAHQEMGQINEAARFAQKALTIHETLQDRLNQARSLNNLGYMLLRQGEYSRARTHIDRAIRIFEEQNVESNLAIFLCSLAEVEHAEGRLETAQATARRALETAGRHGEAGNEAEAYRLIGMIANSQGRDSAADDAFAQALAAADRGNVAARLVEIHEHYAEILETRGDLVSANRHLKQAIAAQRPVVAQVELRMASA